MNATGSQPLGEVCTILCDLEGIKAFVNWIEHAGLSPIWDCEQLGVCKTNDYGDATITQWASTPQSGPQNTEFDIAFVATSNNGTGSVCQSPQAPPPRAHGAAHSTGEIQIHLHTCCVNIF